MLIGPSKFIMYYYYCITPILYPYQVVIIIITLLLLFINEASEEDIAVTLSCLGRKNNHRVWGAVTAADGNRFTPGRLRFPGEISKWDPCKVGGDFGNLFCLLFLPRLITHSGVDGTCSGQEAEIASPQP